MATRFKHHVAPSAPGHGFNAFEMAWNQEAGQHVVESLTTDDESIILIHHKTTKQLQEHYDRIQQQRAASYSTANPIQIARTAALHVQLFQTRQLVRQPIVTQTTPRQYPQSNVRHIPGGAPMTLPPEVGMVNVGRHSSEHGHAPFQVDVQSPRECALTMFSCRLLTCVQKVWTKKEAHVWQQFSTSCTWDTC